MAVIMRTCLWIAVLLFTLSSCKKPVSPKYIGYENFQMEKMGLKDNILSTRVKLYNPNAFPLQVKSASVDVYINDHFFGHSALDSLITLPAKDTSFVPLRLTASAKDILSNTLRVWLNPDVKVKIRGSARAGRGGFFVNVPIDYEGTQRIEL
jgi:LEA14-like dessication related protein